MQEPTLKPCPFCGGAAIFMAPNRGFGVFVRCAGSDVQPWCMAEMYAFDEQNPVDILAQKKWAAAIWNRRAEPQE